MKLSFPLIWVFLFIAGFHTSKSRNFLGLKLAIPVRFRDKRTPDQQRDGTFNRHPSLKSQGTTVMRLFQDQVKNPNSRTKSWIVTLASQ